MSRRTIESLDLIGGAPALDFANTINSRMAPAHDYLRSFTDLVSWTDRAGLIEPSAAMRQTALAAETPRSVQSALDEALSVRDTIYRVFSAIASGVPPADADVRSLLVAYGTSASRIVPKAGRVDDPRWDMSVGPDTLLDPIRYSAGSLLLDPRRPRVGECPGCGWLYLDRSRNRRRRWCDMQICGTRVKMRRYRSRARR